jgi:serine protease Do
MRELEEVMRETKYRTYKSRGDSGNRSILIPAVGLLAFVWIFLMQHSRPDFAVAAGRTLDGPEIELLERQNKAFERIIDATAPSIVYVRTEQVIKAEMSPLFMDPSFREFFGGPIPHEQKQHALGTGVIFQQDGYIVTNNHVVKHASSVEVMLTDKKVFKAKVVGTDPDMDVAVIKIDAKGLPAIALGDSSSLHVGDTVLAFGNPFGLNFTVTRGSVSALGRSQFDIEPLQDFIQTDAAINPGNSGGALMDIKGQMIGVNTAILSGNSGPGGSGGFIGIGFAIPINMAKRTMESLIKTGKVTRAYLGVTVSPVTQEFAREFKVPDTSGAFVQDVAKGSPAEKAGIKPGDVIRRISGRTINESSDLLATVASSEPGSEATLEILRSGEPLTLKAKLDPRPADLSFRGGSRRIPLEGTLRGVAVQELSGDLRKKLELPADVQGVVVIGVDPGTPAAQSLAPGDVIMSVNRKPVSSVAEFNKLASEAKGSALLRVFRDGQAAFVVISPESDEGE